MIIVSILGMDYYEAIEKTERLHDKLAQCYGVKKTELEFFAPQSFIIHDGIEQTTFRLNINIEAPEGYEDREREATEIIFEHFRNTAIHMRVRFNYFNPEHEYVKLDEEYPEYMTPSNMIKAEREEKYEEQDAYEKAFEENYEEPYMGDIISEFDNYIKDHPNASSKEVYEAISGIRENVTKKKNGDK